MVIRQPVSRGLVTVLLIALVVASAGLAAGREETAPTLAGVVRDKAGVPLPSVWVHRVGAKNRLGIPVWVRTDVDGRFRIARPPAGTFVLRLVPGTTSLTEGTLRTFEGGARELSVVMDPGPILDVLITDYVRPEGKPRYARVTWKKADGGRPTRYAPVAGDGKVRFVGVPAGTPLELWALAKAGRPVHVRGLKAGPKPSRVTSVEGKSISGVVLGVTRSSMRRVSVTAEAPARLRVGRTTLEPTGAFTISDLPPGTYTLRAQYTSGAISASPPVTVKAGATDVRLDLGP